MSSTDTARETSGPRRLAVAINVDQAKHLSNSLATNTDVLALSPDAARDLRDRGFTVLDGDTGITCFSHARSIALLDALQKPIMDTYAQKLALTDVERDAIGHYLFQLIATANLADRTLRPHLDEYDEFLWLDASRVRSTRSADELLFQVVSSISPFPGIIEPGADNEYSALHGKLCNWLNDLLARRVKRKRLIAFMDNGNPLARRIATGFSINDDAYALLTSRPPGTTMAGTLLKFARKWRRKSKDGQTVVYAAIRASELPPITPPKVSLPDIPLMSATMKRLVEDVMPRCFSHVRREVDAATTQMNILPPAVVVGDHMFFANRRQAAHIQNERGLPVLQVTHGSHAVPEGPVSQAAARVWGEQGRLRTDDVSHVVPKTPGAAQLIEMIHPQSKASVYPIGLFKPAPLERQKTDRFTIVIGGNYQDIERTVPWQMESAYEYQRLILSLIDEIMELPDVLLKLRVKPTKSEGLSLPDINDKITSCGVADRVIIDGSTDIRDLLAQTDLMISNLSTLADEALASRVPVMLMTRLGHYHHWPARTSQPTPDDRSSVYACDEMANFHPMIDAIRNAHHGRPLTEEEVAPYAWPDDTSDNQAKLKADVEKQIAQASYG